MLQARGQVTAAEVADELEISERTARRDLDALGMAGLPVYSVQGRNGGWRLAGGGRTDLSGLTAAESRALFLLAGSAATTPTVKAALRKLVRALPEAFRADAEAATSAVVVDDRDWDQSRRPRPVPEHLDAVQQAVVSGSQVRLGYVSRDRRDTTRVVDPLGLVSKGDVWYLVAQTDDGRRTFRIDRVTTIEPTGERVTRPEDFDLAQVWHEVVDEVSARRTPVRADALVRPDALRMCQWILGNRIQVGEPTVDGRVSIEIRGHSVFSLAGELAGLGAAIEVLAPDELRGELARIGRELGTTYAPATTGTP